MVTTSSLPSVQPGDFYSLQLPAASLWFLPLNCLMVQLPRAATAPPAASDRTGNRQMRHAVVRNGGISDGWEDAMPVAPDIRSLLLLRHSLLSSDDE